MSRMGMDEYLFLSSIGDDVMHPWYITSINQAWREYFLCRTTFFCKQKKKLKTGSREFHFWNLILASWGICPPWWNLLVGFCRTAPLLFFFAFFLCFVFLHPCCKSTRYSAILCSVDGWSFCVCLPPWDKTCSRRIGWFQTNR